MSVSLCVLRVEVAEGSPLPAYIHYSSFDSHLPVKMSGISGRKSGQVAEADRRKFQHRHKGKREMHEIIIETHENTDGCSREATGSQPVSKESSPVSGADSLSGDKMQAVSGSTGRTSTSTTSQINFFSGNPFVEVTKGILHLFKENHMTPLSLGVPRSEMICILAVPAAMTSHDLLQFLAPLYDDISHVRIIRDSTPNQYMVLIKFRNQEATDEFYKAYNGTRFNSIEPEVCHLVYVARVETTKEFDAGCLPLEGHTELPTCPVCLERMDESVDGILTTLCNHSFHGSCLDKWGDTSCPVCRYCQTPEVVADNRCSECHVQESLWICLICGHVGCGRYVEGHAYNHFVETQHTYAMQLGNNRVWDYAGDNYVHRLIQNKGDGKLVELNETANRASVEQEEKLDSMQLEYTYLLTSQLESQRLYFEDKIIRVEKESHRQIDELKERTKQMAEMQAEMKRLLDSANREKGNLEKKISQLNSKFQKTVSELKEEKQINECLQSNQSEWQKRVESLDETCRKAKEEKEKEIEELREQLRDVMFFLDAQQKLAQTTEVTQEEIRSGQVMLGQATARTSAGSASGSGSSRRKKHK